MSITTRILYSPCRSENASNISEAIHIVFFLNILSELLQWLQRKTVICYRTKINYSSFSAHIMYFVLDICHLERKQISIPSPNLPYRVVVHCTIITEIIEHCLTEHYTVYFAKREIQPFTNLHNWKNVYRTSLWIYTNALPIG